MFFLTVFSFYWKLETNCLPTKQTEPCWLHVLALRQWNASWWSSVEEFIQLANEWHAHDSKFDKLATRKKCIQNRYCNQILVVGFGYSFQCDSFEKDSLEWSTHQCNLQLVMLLLSTISSSHLAAQNVTFVSSIQTINFSLRTAF